MKNSEFFIVSKRCNNRCVSCVGYTHLLVGNNPSLEKFKEFLRLQNKKLKNFDFTGGEPTLNLDLFKMISYTQNIMPETEIQVVTNCRIFSYKDYVEKLHSLKIKNLKISPTIYGPNSRIHDAITRTPSSFEQTIQGIKNLLEFNFDVELRIVINKINYRYLEKIANFISQNFSNLGKVVLISMKMTGEAEKNKEVVCCKITETLPYAIKAVNILTKNKFDVKLFHFPLCIVPQKNWENTAGITVQKSEITFAKQCKECIVKNQCSRIWKSYIKIFGSEEFRPVKSGE